MRAFIGNFYSKKDIRLFLKCVFLVMFIGACSSDDLDKSLVLQEDLGAVKIQASSILTEDLLNEASFVADFDAGIFALNGKLGTKESLIDPYRVQPRGQNGGVKDNALQLPLTALGVTGGEWSYWIEVTFPNDIKEWPKYSFFAESGTVNRSNRILHRVSPGSDSNCASEFHGGGDARYLGVERSSFSMSGGTRILVQQAIDGSSIITKLGDDPATEKKGVLPTEFQYLAVGADLLGFQHFPNIKINRVVVFNKKLNYQESQSERYGEATFVADFDEGTFLLNGRAGTKASLIDPYRVQPVGQSGVKNNALRLPLDALGVTGDAWSYWIEVTFPNIKNLPKNVFFAESGTADRTNRILHLVTSSPDSRCASEIHGGVDAKYLGAERTSYAVNSGTRILIQQAMDKSSVITKLGDDPAWEKTGDIPSEFQYLTVGVDLLGYQNIPDIKINRIVVFNKKLDYSEEKNQGYDVSEFTDEVFFDSFNWLNLRSGSPSSYEEGQGIWTPRFSYGDNDSSPKGWSGVSNVYMADPTYNWPNQWSPFEIENYFNLKMRVDRTTNTGLASQVPINPNTGRPYEWIGGVITTKHSNTFKAPCYIEARIKFPKASKGIWNAFWLYNNDDGHHKEIDIAEYWSKNPESYGVAQHSTIGSSVEHEIKHTYPAIDLTEDYHRYGLVWADGKLVFLLDGKEVATLQQHEALTDAELYIILNAGIGGYQGDPDQYTPNSNEMLVDWVRVQKRP
ncbi:glycoside hydrolase family 16 protein [uncultured Kriegella sp.]|uniref:glycoside hydrolase family 16 protein n=1 Tax=uncultured Kriegella sp. TaxID=1798910 RepID=UPI0030DB6C4C